MSDRDPQLAYFRITLAAKADVTRHDIRQLVKNGPFSLSTEDAEEIIRHLEASFTISQSTGATVKADHHPWLSARRGEIDFYYWDRLRRYLIERDVLPPQVISTLDSVTDEILDYCGNPAQQEAWARRGMVIGHVQSGKTTNYAALLCKAADAGYKVIILLTGITNSLRKQTQERLDETFIGKKSVFGVGDDRLTIVNYADEVRFPGYGTSRDRDFSKVVASNFGVTIAALREPIIFITKKNKATLEALREWLDLQNQGKRISEPLLLIDDEADNASINTAANGDRVTAINGAIREMLALFERSTYVGYTATPFANIFIDPDTQDEMLRDDLFPRHFIKALDPPTSYVGAERVFSDRGDLKSMIKLVDDAADLLPLKHKRDLKPAALPASLLEAVRVFVLTRAIRILRGDGAEHSSMMINVSRFNDVQDHVTGMVYVYLDSLKNSIVVNAGLGRLGLQDQKLAQLKDDCEREFVHLGIDFSEIQGCLGEAIANVATRTINMRGGILDYSQHRNQGLHVVAIGGLALSRGLTLEGLTVSYILRNVAASDTLMQMARWFGYRPGYEDLCRLYLPEASRDHYEFIAEATEELRSEVKRMEALGLTPEKFGLRVRQSPAAMRVTAANKMRNASELTDAKDYSGSHVEGYALLDDQDANQANLKAARDLLSGLGAWTEVTRGQSIYWSDVDGARVFALLRKFKFSPAHSDLGPIEGDRSLLADYISDRLGSELSRWDVAVPTNGEGAVEILPGCTRSVRSRAKGKVGGGTYRVTGTKNKAANPLDEAIGLTDEAVDRATSSGLRGARAYCMQRERPLLLVHFLNRTDGSPAQLGNLVVTLSFCLPETRIDPTPRTYQVGPVYRQMMLDFSSEGPEGEDDEVLLDSVDA